MEVNYFLSTFNEIEMTTPYGDTDNVLELNIDSSSDAYVLQDVIKLSSTYTFSIWYRTESDSQITFNVLGESEIVDSTTSWNKFVKTVTVETLDETSIYILPSVGVNSYFYEGYLVEGITDTSWTPAPEDVDEEIYSTINTIEATAQSLRSEIINTKEELQSSFEQTSKEINIRVENTETSLQTVINESIPKINKEVDEATSQLQVQIDNISGTVAVVQDNITTMSKTIQDANGWKLLFATLGMYDGDDIGEKPNNVIWMNKEGIRVSNRDPSDQTSKKAGNTTLITDQEFSGYVNDGSVTGDGTKMFEFNKEHVYTNRLKADNGIDLITLKIIPAKYGTVNALNFISGSGNS